MTRPTVECVGLPGSGKSTYFPSWAEKRPEQPVDLAEAVRTAMLRPGGKRWTRAGARFLHRAPGATMAVFRRSLAYRESLAAFVVDHAAFTHEVITVLSEAPAPQGRRARVLHNSFNLFAAVQFGGDGTGPPIAVEEGFAQRALLVLTTGGVTDGTAIGRFVDLMPSPTSLLVVECEPGECVRRIQSRGGSPSLMPSRLGSEGLEWLRTSQTVLRALVHHLERAGVAVSTIDNRRAGTPPDAHARVEGRTESLPGAPEERSAENRR